MEGQVFWSIKIEQQRVNSFFSTSDTCLVTHVKNLLISYEQEEKNGNVHQTNLQSIHCVHGYTLYVTQRLHFVYVAI